MIHTQERKTQMHLEKGKPDDLVNLFIGQLSMLSGQFSSKLSHSKKQSIKNRNNPESFTLYACKVIIIKTFLVYWYKDRQNRGQRFTDLYTESRL